MTPLYNVSFTRPDHKPVRLGVVRAVPQRGPAGNWFPAAGDIMTPDVSGLRAMLPAAYRKAYDRTGALCVWHTADSLHAASHVVGSRGRALGTITFDGYEHDAGVGV